MSIFIKLIIKGIKDLGHNKREQTLALAAVTLVVFLGSMFLLVMHNAQLYVLKNQGTVNFEVYWEQGLEQEDLTRIKEQWTALRAKENLSRLETYTPRQGLLVLEEKLGHNLELSPATIPIPPTAILAFRLESSQPETEAREIYNELQNLPLVQKVKFNPMQVDLASSWTKLARQILWPFVIFLTLLIGLILGNTFKLAQMSRQEEIEILQLVGAANWYIQLPLLVGGVVQALLGGFLALGLLRLAQESINNILNQAPLWLEVNFLNPGQILAMLSVLSVTGLLSSWVAIRN